jgi:MFS family permease
MRLWLLLFLPFAGGYFLSYLFRTANAVVGPVLTQELGLSASDLGFLTSAYFLTFALAQIPLGMLLDRFGSRRVEAGLLLIAASGAALFAAADSVAGLALGRGLIGIGVSACLMASFKAFIAWFPRERQASLTGWIMAAGGLGALAATAPLEAVLQLASWRAVFYVLAGLTVAAALWIFSAVPEAEHTHTPEPLLAQWRGVRTVFASAHFWRFAPIGLTQIAGLQAIHGLWATSWLMRVNGYSRPVAAEHLAAMSLAMLLTYVAIGLWAMPLARRGIPPLVLMVGGIGSAIATLLAIGLEATAHTLPLWALYGVCVSFGTLAYSQCAAGFPPLLAGRVNTAFNLMVFVGAFALQWGIGVAIDLLGAAQGTLGAHRSVFIAIVVAQAASLLWFLGRGRTLARSAQP